MPITPVRGPAPLYIGIDPGKDGALAVIDVAGRLIMLIRPDWNGHVLHGDTVAELRGLDAFVGERHVAIEAPVPFGRQNMLVSTIAVARSGGIWIGALSMLGVSDIELVLPRVWQAALMPGIPKGQTKQQSRSLARRIFGAPFVAMAKSGADVHDGCADAVLIAEWRRQQHATQRLVARAR
jgi:hypothetical protein